MHKIPITAAAVLAMLTVAAAAQTTPSSPNGPRPSSPGSATAPAPIQREPAINPLTKEDVSNIEGTTVYGSDDGKLGHVSTVLMDPQSKKIDRLVVTAGGLLGMGGHRVAPDRSVQVGFRQRRLQAFDDDGQLEVDAGMGRRRRDGYRVEPAVKGREAVDRRGRRGQDLQIVSRKAA